MEQNDSDDLKKEIIEKFESLSPIGNLFDVINYNSYEDLNKFSTIEQLFQNSLNVILFFPVEDQFNGHYTCMMFHQDINTISYFCSYGLSPMRNIIMSNYLKKFNEQTLRLLPNLILNFTKMGGKFLINSYQYQEKKFYIRMWSTLLLSNYEQKYY